jgi:hypothetical protein
MDWGARHFWYAYAWATVAGWTIGELTRFL